MENGWLLEPGILVMCFREVSSFNVENSTTAQHFFSTFLLLKACLFKIPARGGGAHPHDAAFCRCRIDQFAAMSAANFKLILDTIFAQSHTMGLSQRSSMYPNWLIVRDISKKPIF